jgi:hypothetical protein
MSKNFIKKQWGVYLEKKKKKWLREELHWFSFKFEIKFEF